MAGPISPAEAAKQMHAVMTGPGTHQVARGIALMAKTLVSIGYADAVGIWDTHYRQQEKQNHEQEKR